MGFFSGKRKKSGKYVVRDDGILEIVAMITLASHFQQTILSQSPVLIP